MPKMIEERVLELGEKCPHDKRRFFRRKKHSCLTCIEQFLDKAEADGLIKNDSLDYEIVEGKDANA